MAFDRYRIAVWNNQNLRARRSYEAHPIISVYGLGNCKCEYPDHPSLLSLEGG